MAADKSLILSRLSSLQGKRLSSASNAGNMKLFGFGAHLVPEAGLLEEFALHISCPWRIEGPEGVVTGFQDFYEKGAATTDPSWIPTGKGGSLQDEILSNVLGLPSSPQQAQGASSGALYVTSVQVSRLSDLQIDFTQHFRLITFACATIGENWRFFCPFGDEPHCVLDGIDLELEGGDDGDGKR